MRSGAPAPGRGSPAEAMGLPRRAAKRVSQITRLLHPAWRKTAACGFPPSPRKISALHDLPESSCSRKACMSRSPAGAYQAPSRPPCVRPGPSPRRLRGVRRTAASASAAVSVHGSRPPPRRPPAGGPAPAAVRPGQCGVLRMRVPSRPPMPRGFGPGRCHRAGGRQCVRRDRGSGAAHEPAGGQPRGPSPHPRWPGVRLACAGAACAAALNATTNKSLRDSRLRTQP